MPELPSRADQQLSTALVLLDMLDLMHRPLYGRESNGCETCMGGVSGTGPIEVRAEDGTVQRYCCGTAHGLARLRETIAYVPPAFAADVPR